MPTIAASGASTLPVNDTLRWVAAGYRGLAWLWMLILVAVVAFGSGPGDRRILTAAMVVATVWLGVTWWATRSNARLGSGWFATADGLVALGLSSAGLLAGTEDFISGGWPGSWLFMVAFATNLAWTMGAGLMLVASHALLHLAHGLPMVRTAGTFQFITLALVIGWAFDSLRHREQLRLAAEAELGREQEEAARHQERSRLAFQLHDSVLQTLHTVRVAANDADEVRFLTRRQERELRRTIEEFRSPHHESFRVRLLGARDEVEDLCRGTQIVEVLRGDGAVTPQLELALAAAHEAMMNAAKHSGAGQVDLYAEIGDEGTLIHVRDRGSGFDPDRVQGRGLGMEILSRVEEDGGSVDVNSRIGEGTEITIRVPPR